MGGAAQYGWTALIRAAESGHVDCTRLLLDAGADKDAKNNVRASANGGVRGIVELRWRWIVVCSDVFTVFVRLSLVGRYFIFESATHLVVFIVF